MLFYRFDTDPDDLNIDVTSQNVTFRASSASLPTIVDCKGNGRFLNVTNPDYSQTTTLVVGVHTITFENCRAPNSGDGGAIFAYGIVSLTVTDCRFTYNTAKNGGAIAMRWKSLSRVYLKPKLSVSGDSGGFSSNVATSSGGAIFADYADVSIVGTHLDSNNATRGGAVYWLSSHTLIIKNSAFRYNQLIGTNTDGGTAVYATSSGKVTVEDVTFDSNRGSSVGTLAFLFGTKATVTKSSFTKNLAIGGGGGIYSGPQSKLIASDCRFEGNSAIRGGGIEMHSSDLEASKLVFVGNNAAFGGGIYFAKSESTVSDCTFLGNTAENGAGVYATNLCEIKMRTIKFDSNQAYGNGGAIFCDMSNYDLGGMTYKNNTYGEYKKNYKIQDVFCDTIDSGGYCYIEGQKNFAGKCVNVVDSSPKIPLPRWLVGVIIGLAVFIVLLIIAIAFWMYRVRKAHKAHMASGAYSVVEGEDPDNPSHTLLSDTIHSRHDDNSDEESNIGRGVHLDDEDGGNDGLFDVITNPNGRRGAPPASFEPDIHPDERDD